MSDTKMNVLRAGNCAKKMLHYWCDDMATIENGYEVSDERSVCCNIDSELKVKTVDAVIIEPTTLKQIKWLIRNVIRDSPNNFNRWHLSSRSR